MALRRGERALDRWSWAHGASGLALALLRVRAPWAVGLLVGFEVLEAGLRRIKTRAGGLFEYESGANLVADVAVGAVGYLIARSMNVRRGTRAVAT